MRQLYFITNLCILGPVTRISKLEVHQFLVTEEETNKRVLVNRRVFYEPPR